MKQGSVSAKEGVRGHLDLRLSNTVNDHIMPVTGSGQVRDRFIYDERDCTPLYGNLSV